MRLARMLSVVVLMLVSTTVASAATLRTPAFPGDAFGTGGAACYVTNAGTSSGVVSATLYDINGTSLESISTVAVSAHVTTSTPFHAVGVDSPAHCVCVVPTTTTFRCTFVYVDKDHPVVTVIGTP